MHPFAAIAPDTEVRRSEIVATRLARKVGPLFGVIWEQNPFGATWVCDFGALTLAEIARGAPNPGREAQSMLDKSETEQQRSGLPVAAWRRSGRTVWTYRRSPTPAAIAHATLNRYGPDTKAAVVLTGANRLLQDVTAAVSHVCAQAAEQGIVPEYRLAIWAGLVLEAFRGQPALVTAAIQARAIQRALTVGWSRHVGLSGYGDWARSEIGAVPGPGLPDRPGGLDPHNPTTFDLIDATLPLLDLPLPVDDGPLISKDELLEDLANRWCRRLLQVGRAGRGIAWVTEQPAGHRAVQTYVRIGSLIAPFTAEVLSAFAIGTGPGPAGGRDRWPPWSRPADAELCCMAPLVRRAYLLSEHTIANYIRFRDDLLRARPELRAITREAVTATAHAADGCLGPDDPVSLLLAGYASYCEVWDLCRAPSRDIGHLAQAAEDLALQQDRLTNAWRSGILDPGTASYLMEIGTMALGRASAVLGRPAALADRWQELMLARGLDVKRDLSDLASVAGPQRYHLQNYAGYAASAATTASELRRALAIQRACVAIREQVSQGELAEYDAKFTSTLTSRQVAAEITEKLLGRLGPEDAGEYRDVLSEGLGHVRAVLSNPMLRAAVAQSTGDPEIIRVAVMVLPLVARARAGRHPDADVALLADAALLLHAATDCADRMGAGLPEADRTALAILGDGLRDPVST